MHPEWATYMRVLLALHISCGVVGFVCAPVALGTVKGGNCIGDLARSTSGPWQALAESFRAAG